MEYPRATINEFGVEIHEYLPEQTDANIKIEKSLVLCEAELNGMFGRMDSLKAAYILYKDQQIKKDTLLKGKIKGLENSNKSLIKIVDYGVEEKASLITENKRLQKKSILNSVIEWEIPLIKINLKRLFYFGLFYGGYELGKRSK